MGEDVAAWEQMFQELMQEVRPWHTWTLTLDKSLLPNVLKSGWKQYQQWTFAKFRCSSCSRDWASAQVQILFHMVWSKELSRGQVKMRVFAQRCQKCSQPPFEVPEFTQENMSRILNNLVLRILKTCYKEGFKLMEVIPAIKDISLKGPHDSDNCEACLQGCCAQSKLGPCPQTPMPPPPPVPYKDAKEPRVAATMIDLTSLLPKTEKILRPTIGPKVSEYPKASRAPETGSVSRSSAASRLPAHQVSCLGSPVPKITTQLPSSTDRSTPRGVVPQTAKWEGGKALARSPSFAGSSRATNLPGSWSPRANTGYLVQSREHFTRSGEDCYPLPSPVRTHRNAFSCRCCCCLILIMVVVLVVVVVVKANM
ncbi:receptor-transporting protein 3 isoform X2 [Echinops telfairi]|uniref:Receptor-transporting protein 3 isoform X2 n=1 Tax=Echinops telfairi TaxID=9371 RepID=A0AC55DP98_ECHTE|nr:receptor-transporting protein 3 isoform X2 [Echinops telfairi]